MQVNFGPAIIIDAGAAADYPGRFKGFFHGKCGTPESFIAQTQVNLKKIASQPIGKDLLELLLKRHQGIGTKANSNGSPKTVTISNGWGTIVSPDNYNTDASGVGVDSDGKFAVSKRVAGHAMTMAGRGTSVRVRYSVTMDYSTVLKLKTPSFVALAHELIHAFHFLSGNQSSDLTYDKDLERYRSSIIEEALTVGAGTYENTRISENAIRREHGLPIREFYRVPGDCFVNARPRGNAVV